MTNKPDKYFLLLRQKPNQHIPYEVPVNSSLIGEGRLTLDKIMEVASDHLTILDEKKAKVRYLNQARKVYILCGPEGAPFDSKGNLEVIITGPVESSSTGPKSKMNRSEKEMMTRIEKMETCVTEIENSLNLIIEKLESSPDDSTSIVEAVQDQDEPAKPAETPQENLLSPAVFQPSKKKSFVLMPAQSSMSIRSSSNIGVGGESILTKRKSAITRTQEEMIHFAILYSNPLVDIVEKKGRVQTALLINDPVDFSNECANILQCLEGHKKLLNVHIECASSDQFISIIKEKPLILHIMCHGDFDPEKQEYFLEFENSKAELLRMYPSRLKSLLAGTDLSEIQLVFINACHSEAVGRAFLELGVRCVIVSQSEHKLNDEFAKVYSKLFYDELIEGKSVSLAFENAKAQLKAVNLNASDACCCGHSHKPTCSWYQFYKQNGKFLVAYCNEGAF